MAEQLDSARLGAMAQALAADEALAATVRDRIDLLKIRTGVLGAIGLIGLALALWAGWTAASALWLSQAQAGAGQAAQIHLPVNLFSSGEAVSRAPVLMQFAFVGVGLLGVSAASRGLMSRLQRHIWIALLALLAGGAVIGQWPDRAPWRARQALAQAVEARQWEQADQVLAQNNVNPVAGAYVKAQLALARGDATGARTHGAAVLQPLEHYLLGGGDHESSSDWGVQAADFRPDVLRRLDQATYGAPHSQLSLAPAVPEPPANPISGAGLRLLAALAAAGAAAAVLRLWGRMARRVRYLQGWKEDAERRA